LEQGDLKQVEIARHLGVTEAAVSKWRHQLEAQGAQALALHKASGRPPKLSAANRQGLVEKLKAGAIAAGFPTEQWTQARVRQVIQRDLGVDFHPNAISRLLDGLGWSVQKVESRALERDEALIDAWLKNDWPRLKKSAAARRRNRVRR
jgi:transposase